jgi:hypothetical protein
MAERSHFEKAKTYGLKRLEVLILYYFTGWFNGMTVTVHGRTISIAPTYEPTLRQLCSDD